MSWRPGVISIASQQVTSKRGPQTVRLRAPRDDPRVENRHSHRVRWKWGEASFSQVSAYFLPIGDVRRQHAWHRSVTSPGLSNAFHNVVHKQPAAAAGLDHPDRASMSSICDAQTSGVTRCLEGRFA